MKEEEIHQDEPEDVVDVDLDGVEDEPQATPPRENPWEEKARLQGWKAKEEWDGPEDEFIDARAFVKNGELIARIKKVEAEQRATIEATQKFKEHFTKQKEAEYQTKLAELREKKWAALEEGDVAKAKQAETAFEELQAQRPQEPVPQTGPDTLAAAVRVAHADFDAVTATPHFEAWLMADPARYNAWAYATKPEVGIELVGKYKESFAPKAPKSPRESPVSPPRPARSTPAEPSFNELPVDARATFKEWVRMGLYENSKEGRAEFMRGLKESGEL